MKAINILATAAAAILLLPSCHRGKKASDEAEGAMPVDVTQVVTDSLTLYKDYPGTLIADRTVQVVARANGYLSRPKYQVGDFVKQGQLLFTIDSDTYQTALQAAQAALTTARSENAYAEEHYLAVSKAYEKNAVSKMELSQALNSRDQSRANIKSAQSQLEKAQIDISHCTITAPCSGHITDNKLSGGNYVSGEAAPVQLATIYDDAVVTAVFNIEDESFLQMFENPKVRAEVDYSAIPVQFSDQLPHQYTADLVYRAPNVNASTGAVNIQADIKNTYNELRAGMYCTIHMPYATDPKAMLVRDASISTDQLGKFVYVVNDSNKIVYTPIEVGDLANDTMRIVTKGLRPTDRYVTSAMLKVRDGMTVKPVEKKSNK